MAIELDPGRPPGERVAPKHAAATDLYRSPLRLSNVVIAMLTVHVVFDIASVVVDYQMLQLVDRVREGAPVTFEEATALDGRMSAAGMLQLVGGIATAIPFVVWLRRTYRNLGPLGTRWLRFKPGWAVGGWFVPFLWFARPKSIVNDVWRASDPALPRDLVRPPEGAVVPGSINAWWGFLVAGWLLYPGAGIADLRPTLEEISGSVQRVLAADVCVALAGVLAILMVRKISLRQEQRHAALRAAAPAS